MLDITPQWQTVTTYLGAAYSLKQDDKLPDYILALTKGTLAYEQAIKAAWIDFKRNPTEANARKFANFLKTYSGKHWPEVVKSVLGVPELSPQQQKMLEDALGEHHEYVMTSLLPDMLKAASADNLNAMDHRAIFLYAGALWSFGLLATVMFDGLEVRDLADLFLFAGPNDPATCTGERGCEQYAGKVLTVAQILAEDIVPGHLRCVTNCRHMLLPIASPLNKPKVPKPAMDYGLWQSEFKHLAGRHDQKSHGYRTSASEAANTYYHVTKYAKAANILRYDYFRVGIGIDARRGLSTTRDPNFWSGSREVRFVLTPESIRSNYSVIDVREPIYKLGGERLEESESRILSDSPIMEAHNIIQRIEYTVPEYADSEFDEFLSELGTYSKKYGIETVELSNISEKHLPGEHDQLDHGRRSGASHATVSRDWLTSQHVLAGDYGKPGSSQDDLTDTLSKYEVSQEDLAGLRSITDAPPDGYHYANGVMRKTTGAGLLGGDIYGVYDPKTSTLHISPSVLATDSGKKTLLHEIGHHVSQKHAEDEAAYVAWERILKEAPTHIEGTEFVRDTSKLQRKYGLRENSIQGTDELLADSYMASKMGSKAQKAALEALWQDAGTPLQEMLKELGDTVSATELRPIVNNGQVAIVGVPVKVSAELVRATPWYYLEEVVLKHLAGRHDQKSHGRQEGGRQLVIGKPIRANVSRMEFYWDRKLDGKAATTYMQGVVNTRYISDPNAPGSFMEQKITGGDFTQDDFDTELYRLNISNEERKTWKNTVVSNLATDTGMSYDRVNELVGTWASTANDNNPTSLGIQMAAHEEFGAPLSDWQKNNINGVIREPGMAFDRAREDGRKLLRAMYDRTQKELEDAGISEVLLYRGAVAAIDLENPETWPKERSVIELQENALESWSLSHHTASTFANSFRDPSKENGVVYQAIVPRERILCIPKTGSGCLTEYEFIVIGSGVKDSVTIVKVASG